MAGKHIHKSATDSVVRLTPERPETDLKSPSLYLNRELSLLEFNWRILQLALDEKLPLLERIKFLFICSANLDEFFEVRVAGLQRVQLTDPGYHGPDGLPPAQALERISEFAHRLVDEQYRIFNEVVLPALQRERILFLSRNNWSSAQRKWLRRYFAREVVPVISPIGLDLSHPFPRLVNKSLHFILSLRGADAFGRDLEYAVLHIPRSLPRIIELPDRLSRNGQCFVFLSAVVHEFAAELFPGMTIKGCYQFRLTRNSDLFVDEQKIEDLASALKEELQARHFGASVRLEVASNCPKKIVRFLLQKCRLTEQELYQVDGPVNLNRLLAIPDMLDRPELKFPEFSPDLPPGLDPKSDIFAAIREADRFLNHPYESFLPILDFIRQAASDPDVLAIKQTLYRTGRHSEIGDALIDAARAGKEVTAIVELRARFDEAGNIELAQRLQDAGAQVVYGVIGYKTHAKMALVVRREGKALRRYVHLGTGNYHVGNARLYTDYSLLSADPEICEDVHKLFQQLTGTGQVRELRRLWHAPFTLRQRLLEAIGREAEAARAGEPARIVAKMNGLTDPQVIRALYAASRDGVSIDLIVRGICCLRPGVPGVSDNIRVRSVIGRFLEHSRIYYFCNGGDEQLYCASADWMERNLGHRVEVAFPILAPVHRERLKRELLVDFLGDQAQSWSLTESGHYRPPQNRDPAAQVQSRLLARMARD